MKFFIITDYSFDIDVKKRIEPTLFKVDNVYFNIDKFRVERYLKKHYAIFKQRNEKFNIEKTLKFIQSSVCDAFAHEYTSNIIVDKDLNYNIICINCNETETLCYKYDIKHEQFLVYFKSNCGYKMIGNGQLVMGAVLSAIGKYDVKEWIINDKEKRWIDCVSDIEDILDILYFETENNYVKLQSVCDNDMGELFLVNNWAIEAF